MPIKQVVCSICKQTVNKAVTYSVGGSDRACKSHEGVVQKKEQLKESLEKKLRGQMDSMKKRQENFQKSGSPDWSGNDGVKCWVCMNPGLRQDEFYSRLLIEMAKYEKVHGKVWFPFDPQAPKLMKDRCIFVLDSEKAAPAVKYIRDDFKVLTQMGGGIVAICGGCCHTLKIDPLPKMEASLEELVLLGALMKPAIDEMAVKELTRDN